MRCPRNLRKFLLQFVLSAELKSVVVLHSITLSDGANLFDALLAPELYQLLNSPGGIVKYAVIRLEDVAIRRRPGEKFVSLFH